MNPTQITPQAQECCICLQSAQTRNGFEFLTTPGCCGKWFHQSCLTDYMARGGRDCPHCRTAFPPAAVPPTPAPAPAPIVAPRIHPNPIPNNMFQAPPPAAYGGFGRRQAEPRRTLDASYTVEDPLTVQAPQGESDSCQKSGKGDPSGIPESPLQVTMTPEYPVESLARNEKFHVRVSLQYKEKEGERETETERNPLDVVCVVDNSGSMQGEKIENLKKAIEFVVSVLDARDRLSIVTFNSSASIVTHLKAMTGDMKGKVRTDVLPTITANGGTDIYDGMRLGYQVLKERRQRNDNSIMFLLTDGQDRSKLAEKQRIAREMRTEGGTGLFVFGFGTDHDSAHMIEIANACEGSFIYIDTNDTVIDAFGGAIGSQQGQVLRNISVDLQTLSEAMTVQEIQSGSYRNRIDSSSRDKASVTFSDLFQGEKRDFLVTLALPAVPAEVLRYALVAGVASYSLTASTSATAAIGERGGGAQIEGERQRVAASCAIQRLNEKNPQLSALRQRDVLVDADIYRVRCMNAIASAIAFADRNNFEEAKKVLQEAKRALGNDSVSYKEGSNAVLRGMMGDLDDCLTRTTSREEYERRGGRATMSEHFDGHSKQRKLFSKSGMMASPYQTVSSASTQSRAFQSKGGPSSYVAMPPPQPVAPPPHQYPFSAPPGVLRTDPFPVLQQQPAAPPAPQAAGFFGIFSFGAPAAPPAAPASNTTNVTQPPPAAKKEGEK